MDTIRFTPLTGTETAVRYETLYSLAGPKLGPLLVDTNVVLTVAGARGATNLYTPYTRTDIWQQAILLDKKLRDLGIAITPAAIPPPVPAQEQTIVLLVENLRGYAYVSERTRIPGVLPFTAGSVNEWMRKTLQGMKIAQNKGQLDFPEAYLEKLFDGLLEGYPDQANYDEIDWRNKGKQSDLASAAIPSRRYSGCRHTFSFYPEHANDPSIVKTISLWSTILNQFYTSPWFTQVEQTDSFQQVRETYHRADRKTRQTLFRTPTTSVAV
jgi:hypothetical protein